MDQGPETGQAIVESWIGKRVELHYTASSAGVTPHGIIAGPPETRVGTHVLEAVDDRGVQASIPEQKERRTIYVPWHSVLLIQGPSREELEPYESEQTEEAAAPRDRQELMERLANAGTPTEVAIARAAADAWLTTNPSDGDVRVARDRLPNIYPAGD